MTEYKKLVHLVETLKQDVEVLYAQHAVTEELSGPTPPMPIDALFGVASRVTSAVASGTPRIQKIVARARESDPDRQIYNEMMCARIEDLLCDYVAVVYRLLYASAPERATRANEEGGGEEGDRGLVDEREEAVKAAVLAGSELPLEDSAVLADVEGRYDVDLLKRAAAEAWGERVAGDLAQHIAFEGQSRQVLEAEEKRGRALLSEKKRADRGMVLGVLRLVSNMAWSAETVRRAKERTWLTDAGKCVNMDTLGGLLATRIPDTTARQHFASHFKSLCAALLATPEDGNIRRLRCNNQRMIEDYGHCCLPVCPASRDGATACCHMIAQTAEIMWCLLGYRVRYTGQRSLGVPGLLRTGALLDSRMPCGAIISAHEYRAMGYEEFSERLFELNEPNPATQPDLWMEWFDRVGRVASLLANNS